MDHAYVNTIGLLLILIDYFLAWPEVVHVNNRNTSTVKQILRVVFLRNGVPRVLITDNAPEFCDKNLSSWLKRIRCRPYKITTFQI